jgi:hypothetical protein
MNYLIAHPRKLILFLSLSALDLALTLWLLAHFGGPVYETNPVAAWCLDEFGWLGLVAFKAAMVLFIFGLIAVVSAHRPRTGARVLSFGCAALLAVVGYSAGLCWAVPRSAAAAAEQRAEDRRRELEQVSEDHKEFRMLLGRLGDGLASGKGTLREAVEQLAQSKAWIDGGLRFGLAEHNPDRSDDELLAAHVITQVVFCAASHDENGARAWEITRRLEKEFETTFGTPAPRRHREMLTGKRGFVPL